MFDIYLTETGHSGLFSAKAILTTAGTLSFRFSGPLNIIVDSLEIKSRLSLKSVAYKLLDALHQYAYDHNCTLKFRCPKAKAINDQQIAHELAELSMLKEKAA
jgi:hypothetical protein